MFRTAGHQVRTQFGVTASAGQRRGDVETRLPPGSGREQEPGLRPSHRPRQVWQQQPAAKQQNGCLSHPQDLDAPLRIAAQRKINGYRQDYADNHNISFLPAKSPPPPACTANLCVFFFYRPTRRPKRTSRPLDCHRKNSDLFRHGRAAFYQGLKNKVGLAVAKAAALRIVFNLMELGVV